MAKLATNFMLSVLSVAALSSCKNRGGIFNEDMPIDGASIASRVGDKADEELLSEPMALRINIKTNIATFYRNGKPVRSWKVATAREDGRSHTPTGSFRAHELNVCPMWQSTRTGVRTPACAPENPLGETALWFDRALYGLHGVDPAHLSSVTASDPEKRRQSSGCVRNAPTDIAWLADQVAPLYGTTPDTLKKARSEKSYKSFVMKEPTGGLAVIIGNWPTDPRVESGSNAQKSGQSPAQPQASSGEMKAPPPPLLPPPQGVRGRAVANTVASKSGAPLRLAPQDLSQLGKGGSCILPAGRALNFDSATIHGKYIVASVSQPDPACPGFVGSIYLYHDHFEFFYDYR